MFDPAEQANQQMRKAYLKRTETLAFEHPLILHLQDTSLALHFKDQQENRTNPFEKSYILLKNIAHLPLWLFVVAEESQSQISDDQLRNIHQHAAAVQHQVDESPLSAPARAVQKQILSAILNYGGEVARLSELAAAVKDQIAFNIDEAAALRVQGIHQQVTVWANKLGRENWKTIKVLVSTSPMARRDNLAYRYFQWLFDDADKAPSSKQVLEVDSLENVDDAKRILGAHIIDAKAANLFFRDPNHLHADVLAPGLQKVLPTLKKPFVP